MTKACARAQSPLASHHSADSAGPKAAGGSAFDTLALSSPNVMAGTNGLGPIQRLATLVHSPPSWLRQVCPTLPPLLRRESAGGVLDYLRQREQGFLIEGPADELEAERQALRRQSAGNRNARKPCHVDGHREHVIEIHSNRIAVSLLADSEGGRWRRRSEDGADALGKAILEIPFDQCAHLLGAYIVGVVVAGRQHVGADHDASAHFR